MDFKKKFMDLLIKIGDTFNKPGELRDILHMPIWTKIIIILWIADIHEINFSVSNSKIILVFISILYDFDNIIKDYKIKKILLEK